MCRKAQSIIRYNRINSINLCVNITILCITYDYWEKNSQYIISLCWSIQRETLLPAKRYETG